MEECSNLNDELSVNNPFFVVVELCRAVPDNPIFEGVGRHLTQELAMPLRRCNNQPIQVLIIQTEMFYERLAGYVTVAFIF